jgi:chaperonin GroEL (HSP60 family)
LLAVARIGELAENVVDRASPEFRKIMVNCTQTAVNSFFFVIWRNARKSVNINAKQMNSKLIASHREFFAEMVVDTVLLLDDQANIDDIGVKKVLVLVTFFLIVCLLCGVGGAI